MPAFYFNRIFEQNLLFFLFYYLKYWISLPCQFSSSPQGMRFGFLAELSIVRANDWLLAFGRPFALLPNMAGEKLRRERNFPTPFETFPSHSSNAQTQSAYRLISPHISEFAVPPFPTYHGYWKLQNVRNNIEQGRKEIGQFSSPILFYFIVLIKM